MRFLCYTLGDPSVPIPPPTPELFTAMDAFMEDATRSGALVAAGGLGDPNEGRKVQYSGGEFTVLDGPFTEAKELIGGWAIMECRDVDEAVEWTKRFLAIAGEGVSTVRPIF